MTIPPAYSKRLTHTYNEEYFSYDLEDYNGVIANVENYCYIHMEPSSFSMSISDTFTDFLLGVNNGYLVRKRAKRAELAINSFEKEVIKDE